MSYLSLDIDSLVWEIKSLMENNYGQFHKNNMESHFFKAKQDILNSFADIIEQNKEDIFEELKEELEE